ncbi:hypothetical protein CTER_2621 [Ruminiclostridium cellobioparum subsp. termitidis CT1112]|uniref:Uncharacterized protein n=1 Tax=Ruminiclostridium cellobioparum subsp. termitidis CT1112 TaxID=1195236 RepID=S0FI09_RUMCE|nr:hypothetical protein CTER_2621 [Ruminiclostridium cellobioparum subsp. termitidis CT1112]
MIFYFWSEATPCHVRQGKLYWQTVKICDIGRNRRVADSPENGLQAKPAMEIRGYPWNVFGLSAQ